MSRFNRVFLVVGLAIAAAAVVMPQQTTQLVRVSFETLIGPAITAPANPPSGFNELFFDIDNDSHTTRRASDGELIDLEATGSVINSCPACVITLDHTIKGGWVGNYINSAITANQATFNASVPYRFHRDYVIGAPYACGESANPGGPKHLWWFLNPISNPGSTTTPLPTTYPYVYEAPTAAASCYGDPNIYFFAPKLTTLLYNQGIITGVTSNTLRGWAAALYGSKTTPMHTTFSNTVAAGATNYTNHNAASLTATEAEVELPVASNGTMGNGHVLLDTAQPASQALTFILRKNRTTDVCTLLTIAGGSAVGLYPFSTTCAVTQGDSFSIKITQGAGASASGRIVYIDWEFESTDPNVNGWIIFPNTAGAALTASTNNYYMPFVTQSISATEGTHRFPIARAATGKYLYCRANTMPTNNIIVSLVRNGSAAGTNLTYTAGGASVQGTATTIAFDDDDAYDLNLATGSGTQASHPGCVLAAQ